MLKSKFAGVDKLIPIIFPDFICHVDIDKVIKELLLKAHKQEAETFSAGDINIGLCSCSGRSETLQVDSQDIDSEVINMYDYFHGLVEVED